MFFAVILACRDKARGEKLKISLEENARDHGNARPDAEVMLLDVSSLQSVRSFANQWHQQQRPLHGLINNAGIFDIGSSNAISSPDHPMPVLLTTLSLNMVNLILSAQIAKLRRLTQAWESQP